jgi:hypothetical protein
VSITIVPAAVKLAELVSEMVVALEVIVLASVVVADPETVPPQVPAPHPVAVV